MRTTIFTARDLQRVIDHIGLDCLMDHMIQGLGDALANYDEGELPTPTRDGFNYSAPHQGLIEWMPAMRAGESAVIKLVGYHPANPQCYALPTILSCALQLDTANGRLLSLLDSTFLTAVRTGAASAVASRVLAAPDSRTLGLIGAGAQAVTQLHALSRVFDLKQVMVFDTDRSAMNNFGDRLSSIRLPGVIVRPAALEEIQRESDIICTATSVAQGDGPVLSDEGLNPWLHINAVGSDFPGKSELPPSLLQRSLVCPDFLPQARREGECQQLAAEAIGPDLVQVVKDPVSCQAHHGRTTVFDSTGWALEDYVAVEIFQRLAAGLGCGTELELTHLSLDPRNPYAFATPLGAETATSGRDFKPGAALSASTTPQPQAE